MKVLGIAPVVVFVVIVIVWPLIRWIRGTDDEAESDPTDDAW